jgi:hypothetical protein
VGFGICPSFEDHSLSRQAKESRFATFASLPQAPAFTPLAPPAPPPPPLSSPDETDSWLQPLAVPQPQPEVRTTPQAAPATQPPPSAPLGKGALWRHEHGREVLLQGFHWDSCKHDWYQIVMGKLDDIKAAGFTGIWLPPPSDSLAPQGYLPRDLYKLDTKYGSEQQLRTLIGMIHERGMHAIADIVVNHRCATAQGAGGQWNKWEGVKMNWGEWAVCAGSFAGQGSQQSGQVSFLVTLRARWVTLRARWVTLRARWVTLRARWVTLRARWVTLRARWVR